MTRAARAALALAFGAAIVQPALAQKRGGTLRIYYRDNLPSASVHPLRPHCVPGGRQPQVKGFVHHHNSIYNNWRFENVWLDK